MGRFVLVFALIIQLLLILRQINAKNVEIHVKLILIL